MAGMVGNLFARYKDLDGKIETLQSNVEALSSREADIKVEVEVAESRPGKKRKNEVDNWLKNVDLKRSKVQSIVQESRQRNLPSLISLDNRIDKLIGEVRELHEQGKFPRGLLLDMPETKVPLLTTKLIGQAVEKNLNNIWACLMDDKILRIGIYGMGGAGKTELATQLYNRLLEESESSVHWVTLSQDFSIRKLQDEIAKSLKLEDFLKEDDEKKRAAKLAKAFEGQKSCVLFLDDVWNPISLNKIGIPDDEVKGCKVILTTRSKEVCDRMLYKNTFKVDPISPEEAWDLFSKTLGQHLPSEVREIAMSVAAKCAGLPLGIITMAGSMRGVHDVCEWRNVLGKLEELTMEQKDMENEVFPVLEFSYSRLNDTKLQLCFLYCALYPEDHKIDRNELISYFIAEGWIDKRKSWQAKIDEGHTMLNNLERSCLLESCQNYTGNRSVKMHDLIRDTALKITKAKFMVKACVDLTEIPNEQEWTEDLEKVSLMYNRIEEIPWSQSTRCPRLSTLILKGNHWLDRIANSFFEHMHAIQVLDLSETKITKLPNSISDLEKLTALLLKNCDSLTYVPPLGKLTALQELDLSRTAIKELPGGVERLVNLKILNMEETEKLERIPSGTFGRLSHLQHLSLHCTSGPVEVQAEELEGLLVVEVFKGRLDDVHGFKSFIKYLQRCGPQLNNYYLSRHYYEEFEEIELYDCSKAVILRDNITKREGDLELGKDGFLLPCDLQFLEITEFRSASSCLADVFCGNARDLKFCEIERCFGIECIVLEKEAVHEDDQGESSLFSFQSLEILSLFNLPDLRTLFWSKKLWIGTIAPPRSTFSSLKELHISRCHKLNSLFTPGLLLESLEVKTVELCNQTTVIFDDEGMRTRSFFSNINDHNNRDVPITHLPKLRSLLLYDLPELKSICEGILMCDSIKTMEIIGCPQLRRLPFSLPLFNGQPPAPSALEQIKINDINWSESLEWDHPNDQEEETEKEVVHEDDQGESSRVSFQSLEILILCELPDLRAIFWSKKLWIGTIAPPRGTFSSLKKLLVSCCHKLNSLFTPGLLLENLEEITVECCGQMIVIFDDEGIRTRSFFSNINDDNNRDVPITHLPKLRSLLLCSLPELKSICEGILMCDSIKTIVIRGCPQLKRLPFSLPLFNGQPLAPSVLEQIYINDINWWESLEWDHPNTKDVLLPFLSSPDTGGSELP